MPLRPTSKQLEFLAAEELEVLFGGAAGGAKSVALLMGALMFAEVPGYRAMIFRKTYTDLALPGALMDVAAEWLSGTPARWSERDKTWLFPSGATLTFGYLDGPRDRFRYQGSQAHYFGFDELTQIRQEDYLYLFSRARKTEEGPASKVPMRIRAASNPGGESHAFVHERFVEPESPSLDRRFIPSRLEDNPYLNKEEYERALSNLDETTYRQLRLGDWVEHAGQLIFLRDWWRGQNRFDPTDPRLPRKSLGRFAAFDTANKDDKENAYTVGVVADLMEDYSLNIVDVQRGKPTFPDLPEWTLEVLRPHMQDLKLKGVWIEEAASGLQLLQVFGRTAPAWLRNILWASRPVKSKEDRWRSAALWCKRGGVKLPHPGPAVPWLYEFERELFNVPNSKFLDQADALSMLINELEVGQGVMSEGWTARTSSVSSVA